ncbi:MAG TPA: nucleotidyltransferase family protein [Armatimonadota bacterium]|nr:nucleotidyltransferase family protein [Armatimonadota bacterium]
MLMKAYLLAAGRGERLRPLTDRVPKCLVPIAGRPLLAHWLELFHAHNVDEVLINTHHLAEQVREFVRAHRPPPRVILVHEPELLGTAGTVQANRGFVECEPDFLVAYADNLTRADLTSLVVFHRRRGALVTIALFHAPDPTRCGIAQLAADGRVTAFVEKPEHPQTDLANAGIYAMSSDIFDYLGDQTPLRLRSGQALDFGRDVFPRLIADGAAVYGWETTAYHLDIGTPAALAQAERDVAAWSQEARA